MMAPIQSNIRWRGLITALTVFSLCHPLIAKDFYVAPGGNDQNPGTKEKPFASLPAARDAARAQGGTGHTIWLAPGRYFNAGAIAFDDRDSGLTVKGEQPGATAEIYGGLPVTGWQKWKGNIWRAPVPKDKRFYNLIVDGKPATMAQTPNAGSGFGGGAGPAGNGAVRVPQEWRGYDYSDAQVFTFIGANWFAEMRAVLKGTADAGGVLPVDEGSGQCGGMNGRLYMRGVLEFHDEPGEWCLKHKEGFVYYWPALPVRRSLGAGGSNVEWPGTGTPAGHVIVRPTGERLLDVTGRSPATPAKDISFENLSLIGSDFCERWYIFPAGKDGSTPEPLQQGMVFGENVERLAIRNCRLLASGHAAVWLNKHAQNCVVENSLITGAGFAGVYMNGWTIGDGPFKSAAESYVNKGHRIESNFIYDCSKYVGGGGGIQFYQSGDNLIARNEIGQMPRYGISCKGLRWGCLPKSQYGQTLTFDNHWDFLHSRNNRIVGNDIYSVCRNSCDYGGIESWGPGRDNLWENNAVHDLDQALEWDAWAHIIFADDASHYLTIRNNILYHCHGGAATGAFMMKNIGEEIANNLVADCTLGRLVTLAPFIEPGWGFTVRRNVFALDGSAVRYDTSPQTFTGMAGTIGSLPADVKKGVREVDYNVIAVKDPAKCNPSPYPENGMDTHSYFGDPMLRRAKPAWDIQYADYCLAASSPAFKLGFKAIPTDSIGLRKDFPFDKAQATRRVVTDKIQAEDYQRMNGLRTRGGEGIYAMQKGSWAKYANLDFGAGKATQAVFKLDAPAAPNASNSAGIIELRLDAPDGKLIGRLLAGQATCPVTSVKGVHNVFLVYTGDNVKAVDWFKFESEGKVDDK
ncbi:MAG: carbohydrate-binding protein [Planctomycetota bacterium]|nr:carbohydrate-binding protein [Planctomycetota bacterium]